MGRLLEVRGIDKSFGGVSALHAVDFSVEAGQIHALLGENGAGKSTLIKVLTGLYRADAGGIFLEEKKIAAGSPAEAEAAGISTVYQEVNLVPSLSVTENITLGRQPGKFGWINWRAARRRAETAMARLELTISPDAELGNPVRGSTAAGGHRPRPRYGSQTPHLGRTHRQSR